MTESRQLLPVRILIVTSCALITSVSSAGENSLKLSGLFSNHMVLQRELPLRITGTSTPGDTVKVTLSDVADGTAEAKVTSDGSWDVSLPAQKAGGPYAMTVADSDETTVVQDLLIGDIWVCSGQSNMDFALKYSLNPQPEISQAQNSNLRFYQVQQNKALKPLEDLNPVSQWKVCTPDTAPDFSAVAYYFGQHIQREINIPIGLIQSAWGGTKVEWWTPAAGLEKFDAYKSDLTDVKNGKSDAQLAKDYPGLLSTWIAQVQAADPGNSAESSWAASDLDDSSWEKLKVPHDKRKGYLSENDGTLWHRRSFTVTDLEAAMSATLKLDCIDDLVIAFINGKQVGASQSAAARQSFKIAEGTLVAGENTIALQVINFGGAGGICGSADALKIIFSDAKADNSIKLAGDWKTKPGTELTKLPAPPATPLAIRPTVLYNAMIAPLQSFPIRGTIWYQGESNASHAEAPVYAEIFGNMITEWRKGWGIGDFPFLFVQLASYRDPSKEPAESSWAQLREAQEDVLSQVKNTAMASAIDIGEANDIHPKNKRDVGNRLALGALAIAYGKPVEHMGPLYESHKIDSEKIVLRFSHSKDLKTSGSQEVKGFAIAGKDGKFVWANAIIVGDTVSVSSDTINQPMAVRYGWSNYSIGNLYNGVGLPANPFRTDKPNL